MIVSALLHSDRRGDRGALLARRGGRLRRPGDHHGGPLLGRVGRPRVDGAHAAVAGLRQARPVLGAFATLRGRPARAAGDGRGSVPWRTEALVYRSDLAERLPAGLRMARPSRVRDLDDLSAAVWLEPVRTVEAAWDLTRYSEAAPPRRTDGGQPSGRRAGRDREPRLAPGPGLRRRPARRPGAARAAQRPPLVAPAVRPRSARCGRGCSRPPTVPTSCAAELIALPTLASHGDACPNNLLVTRRPGLRADRLRLLDAAAPRVRPRSAPRR